jgi:predicted DNA-binding transcriptional regulator AlpA
VTAGKHTPRRKPTSRRDEGDHRGSSDELLTVDEVLTMLRIRPSTWYQWRQTGQAPAAIKLPNGQLRIRRSVLSEWLQARENPTP